MKVKLEYESGDANGEKHTSVVTAVMKPGKENHRLTFMEDLSGEGNVTRSTMLISMDSMRLIRRGELDTEFFFGRDMVHNTGYKTPCGIFPVTITTREFEVKESHMLKEGILPENYSLTLYTTYILGINGEELPMSIKVRVTNL